MSDTSSFGDTYGLHFDLTDVAAALAYKADSDFPIRLCAKHEYFAEVIYVDGRYSAHDTDGQFTIRHMPSSKGRFIVAERLWDANERVMWFADIIEALEFIDGQRGAEWPED